MSAAEALSATLFERGFDVASVEDAVATTAAGRGRAVLLEGPAGIGKTELLLAAQTRAEAAGLRVLTARGGELERELGLGVVRQLFEPVLVRASDAEREELLRGPAAEVIPLLGLDRSKPDPAADELAGENALYWLCAQLAQRRPLMIAIDDVHWGDQASLRWIAYLARRLDSASILLVLARRTREPGIDGGILARIAAEPLVETIRPKPLSSNAVRELVREKFEDRPQEGFARACHRAGGGNPLFTHQLLEAARVTGLRPVDADARRIDALVPERVSIFVLGRLRNLPPTAVQLAEQVALLGTHAEVRHAGALSGMSEREVLAAADELAAAGLLRPGQPLDFVHPVIRTSVYESVPAGRRAGDHGRAARLLGEEGTAAARIAMHLLEAPTARDPWAVETLRSAAAGEVVPETRATYLRRAIAEPPSDEVRAQVWLELGRAEALTYDGRAAEHLSEALRLSTDRIGRATAAGQLAYCLIEQDRAQEAEPILRATIGELARPVSRRGAGESEPLLALQAALLNAEMLASSLTAERLEEAIALAGAGTSAAELDLLGMAAMVAPAAGAAAPRVAALAERALVGVDLSTADGLRLIHCPVWALEFSDRLDEADRWLLRVQDAAQARGSPAQFMLAASARAEVSVRRGVLADAEQEAVAALEIAREHDREYGMAVSAAALVFALVEQGRLADAAEVVAGVGAGRGAKYDLSVYVYSRGCLQLALGRPADAVDEFVAAGRLMEETGHDFPGFWPWRVGAAMAQLALGRSGEARGLAAEQLERVRPFGAAGPTGVALRTLGLVEGGALGLELLAGAAEELERSPALLERAKAQLELGAALRRGGKRTASRDQLRRALDLADRCGAVPLAARAREELVTAGGRPRRTRIGGVEALTAGELRVVRRAALGSTNREIAQELFVTVKAVEKHLGSAYGKLEIDGRGQLPKALDGAAI